MAELEPLTPLDTAALFPPLHDELMALLRGLSAADWQRSTVAGAWQVRDIASHLLDGDLRKLALGRDRHSLTTRPVTSFAEVVELINNLNRGGVDYGQRLSPRLLIDLLEVTGRWVSDYVAAQPPHGRADFPVAWADEQQSEVWMDTGREYTERWHHQMQVRDAVGAPPLLLLRRWLYPLLDLSVRALRRAYKDVAASQGTAVVFTVTGDAGGGWSVVRGTDGWEVFRGTASDAAGVLTADPDTAWRLLYNALPTGNSERLLLEGDRRLLTPMLAARSVMV